MKLNPQIFREYDIRGIAGTDLTEEIYERLGQAIVKYTRGKRENNCLVVAHDGRLTSRRYGRHHGSGGQRD